MQLSCNNLGNKLFKDYKENLIEFSNQLLNTVLLFVYIYINLLYNCLRG